MCRLILCRPTQWWIFIIDKLLVGNFSYITCIHKSQFGEHRLRAVYAHILWLVHTHTHTVVQCNALRSILHVQSLPGKRKVAVAGRLTAPDRYRSAFTAVCGQLFSTVILSFTELCSFVVHLLCCVGSINLISSLFPPLQIAASPLPGPPQYVRSSSAVIVFPT